MADGWTRDELQARAEDLRTLMVDTAAAQFAELQALRAELATLRARLASVRAMAVGFLPYPWAEHLLSLVDRPVPPHLGSLGGKGESLMSEPTREQIAAMYATALEQIATLTAENAALKAGIRADLGGGHSLPDFWTAEKQLPYVAQALTKARAERDEARAIVEQLSPDYSWDTPTRPA